MADSRLEAWLRGPVPGISPLLQPVAHALLQARTEVDELIADFPDELLWERPAGVASVGFHLRHLTGVLDRLFTYARGEQLDPAQLRTLADEKLPTAAAHAQELASDFSRQVDRALLQLGTTAEHALTAPREVGRARAPSTVLGLLFHAAEHTQRHVGQLLVTARVQHPRAERPG
jgi:uncharacterized damage-inducible protein DinB